MTIKINVPQKFINLLDMSPLLTSRNLREIRKAYRDIKIKKTYDQLRELSKPCESGNTKRIMWFYFIKTKQLYIPTKEQLSLLDKYFVVDNIRWKVVSPTHIKEEWWCEIEDPKEKSTGWWRMYEEEILGAIKETVYIKKLNNKLYKIIKPVCASIRYCEGECIAYSPCVNLSATGKSKREAIYNLKDIIEATFDTLTSNFKLGSALLHQKKIFEKIIKKCD